MIGGEIGPTGLELDRPRDADPDPPQPARDPLGRPQQRLEQGVDAVETSVRAGLDPGGLVVVAEDPPVEARDGHVDARRAEIRDQDVAGLGVERQLSRRPSAGARTEVALDHEPAVHELADTLRDDRATEPGPGDELRARPRPAETDLVEHRDERVERLVRQRRVQVRLHDAGMIPLFVRSTVDFCT